MNEFDQFRGLREKWITALTGDDPNSVLRQLTRMAWAAAFQNALFKARTLADEGRGVSALTNDALLSFISRCYIESQAAGIRRLVDGSPLAGKSGVNSLTSILKDMRKHADLWTRENMLETEPYQDCCFRSDREKYLDVLCGVSDPARRQPEDQVLPAIFGKLLHRAKTVTDNIKVYVDKHVAHAATSESQNASGIDRGGMTCEEIWTALGELCRICGFIESRLLYGYSRNWLAYPMYDVFGGWDRPFADGEVLRGVRSQWRGFEGETERWQPYTVEEVNKWPEK